MPLPSLSDGQKQSVEMNSTLTTQNATRSDEVHYSGVCKLKYIPLNPIASICASAVGPPVDVLRKPAALLLRMPVEVTIKGKRKRTSQWWLCLADLKLFFYQFQGDEHPRIVSDVREATAVLSENFANVVYLIHADKRKWQFDFDGFYEANKFIFALTECQKVARGETSIYMSAERLWKYKSLGHRCPTY